MNYWITVMTHAIIMFNIGLLIKPFERGYLTLFAFENSHLKSNFVTH